MVSLLNLTPHAVVVFVGERRVEIAASGMVATVAEERSRCGSVPVDGFAVPVWRVRTGTVTGLPTTEPGRWLIVSRAVALAAPDRDDLVVPYGLLRDAAGAVTGCTGFARIGHAGETSGR